jgi:hypothetical protein
MVRATVLTLVASSIIVGAAAKGSDPWQRVKAATARYHSFKQAEKHGYTAEGEPCVASPQGTMGIHAINPTLMADSTIDPMRPEILLYVPDKHGKLRLVGLEYWKSDADGDLETDDDRPSVLGQPLDGPMPGHNPTMPVHYDVHAWVFEVNPSGFFAPFNPSLSCTP